MIGEGVVKGGTGLKFRYGEDMSRVTLDLDAAWRTGLDEFLRDLKSRLASGWCGFTGEVVVSRPASPRGVPFEYVMQPCDVKLSYPADRGTRCSLKSATTKSEMRTAATW